MNRHILIPLERYRTMQQKLSEQAVPTVADLQTTNADLKKATKAAVKTQEVQELLNRKQEYKEANEEIPKNMDKIIPQKATTMLTPYTLIPPPHLRKKSVRKAPAKKVVKKVAVKKPAVKTLGGFKFFKE